jgi:catechol 2,3-dioxygenase-like lactoylglutathione lyase family enzyme
MSIIRIQDVAYVRFTAPDLYQMAGFLRDFGMVEAAPPTEDRLFMRGLGAAPFVHATERGAPGFAALGLQAGSEDDLLALAQADSVPVETLDTPGGGHVVRLCDPDGFRIEVVAGQTPLPPLPIPDGVVWNQAGSYTRLNHVKRLGRRPSHVLRLGHVVLGIADFRTTERWYKERFGILTSDEVSLGPDQPLGAFMRCDRGQTPTDHHSLFLMQHPGGPQFMHAAFEVHDLDDLMVGHDWLKSRSYVHNWGIGRHYYGSQVFDYWADPWGHELEHWTDGDKLTADVPAGICPLDDLLAAQWGPAGQPLEL